MLGAVKRHSNRCAGLPLPCSLSYCELNSARFWEVLACKLLKIMAPQVGLEPTTLRLTAGQCASCSLILKALLTAVTGGFGSTNCSTIYSLHPAVRKPSAHGAFASERMPHIGGKVGCNTPPSGRFGLPI